MVRTKPEGWWLVERRVARTRAAEAAVRVEQGFGMIPRQHA
jgi:hypothetical protein